MNKLMPIREDNLLPNELKGPTIDEFLGSTEKAPEVKQLCAHRTPRRNGAMCDLRDNAYCPFGLSDLKRRAGETPRIDACPSFVPVDCLMIRHSLYPVPYQ